MSLSGYTIPDILLSCLPRSEHKRHLAHLVGSHHWAARGKLLSTFARSLYISLSFLDPNCFNIVNVLSFRCLQEMVAQSHFLRVSSLHTTTTQHNSNKTSIVRSSRQKYERLYPLLLVQPDGSTINIRYKEPKRILMVSILELIFFFFISFCSVWLFRNTTFEC
jgi:hypothetical protein